MNAIKHRTRLTALAVTCAGVTLGGCADSSLEPGIRPNALRPSLATAMRTADFEAPERRWTPPRDANGVYLLPQACDVWLGHSNPEGAQRYAHQLHVVVPENAIVKLVDRSDYADDASVVFPDYPAGVTQDPIVEHDGYKVFRCSAEDPDRPGFPVVEPVTDHAGKGDGTMLETTGVTLDLNGFGIIASPSATDLDARYDNIGIVIGGSRATLTNGRTPSGKSGVAFFTGWGHSIELEGDNPTLKGIRVGDDPETAEYNILAAGGMGARLSSGTVLVENVKNVDQDDIIGVGFEVLRCPSGSATTVRGSHFVGASDGVFVRRCDNVKVVIENNFISAPVGLGVFVREVNGSSNAVGRRLQIVNNTIKNASRLNSVAAVHLDEESSWVTVTGNRIGGSFCGIQVSRDDGGRRIAGIADDATLTSSNGWVPGRSDTDPAAVLTYTCNEAYAPPGLNVAPVVSLAQVGGCTEAFVCTFAASATDANGIARHEWHFGHQDFTVDGATVRGVEEIQGPLPAAQKTHRFPGPGLYSVTLKAYDPSGLGEMVDPPLVVRVGDPTNRAPQAPEPFPSQCVGMTCSLTGEAEDPDDDVLAYSWRFAPANNPSGTAVNMTGTSVTHTYPTPAARAAYSVTMTATDPGGLSAVHTRTLMLPNAVPTSNFRVECVGGSCTLTSEAADADGDDIIAYEWSVEWLDANQERQRRKPGDTPVVTFEAPQDGAFTFTHGVRDANETASVELDRIVTITGSGGGGRLSQSIAFTPPTSVVTGATFQASATATPSNLEVTIAVSGACSITGTTVTAASAAGTCTLTASQAGDATYDPAAPVVRTVQVVGPVPGKQNQSISFAAPASPATFGQKFTVAATATSGLEVTITASGGCSLAIGTVTMTSGTTACTLTASQAGGDAYNAAVDVTHVVQAIKASASLALSNLTHTYDGSAKSASATTTPAGLDGISIAYANLANAPAAAGEYQVVASLTNADYAAQNATGTLVIGRAASTLIVSGPAELAPGATGDITVLTRVGDGALSFEVIPASTVCTVNGSTGAVVMDAAAVAGSTCSVVAKLSQGTNYEATTSSAVAITAASVAPAKKDQVITFAQPASPASTNSTFTVSATATSGLQVTITASGACTISGNVVTTRQQQGNCNLTATQAGDGEWNAAAPVTRQVRVRRP